MISLPSASLALPKETKPANIKTPMKESSNHHTTTVEVQMPVKALSAASTRSARLAIAAKATETEIEKVIEPRKPKASDVFPSQKEVFHALNPQERRKVFEKKSNGLMTFMVDKLGFKGLELES